MCSTQLAAKTAVFLSVCALAGCGFFIPALIRKINKITADVESVKILF